MYLPSALFCYKRLGKITHCFADKALDLFLGYCGSFLSLAGIGFDSEGYTVKEVGHSAEEQTSFTDNHGALNVSGQDIISARSNIRNA